MKQQALSKMKIILKHRACGHKTPDYDGIGKRMVRRRYPSWLERAIKSVFHSTETVRVQGLCPKCQRKADKEKSSEQQARPQPSQSSRGGQSPQGGSPQGGSPEEESQGFDDPARNRRRAEMMRTFRCNCCEAENRTVRPEVRAFNQGLCCKDGLRDFLEAFRLSEFYRAKYKADIGSQRANAETGQARRESRRRSSTRNTTHRATQSDAGSHRNVRESAAHQSRAQRSSSRSRTRNVEPGIIWDEWQSYPRTNHGMYPPPAPAPSRALPTVPSRSSNASRGRSNSTTQSSTSRSSRRPKERHQSEPVFQHLERSHRT